MGNFFARRGSLMGREIPVRGRPTHRIHSKESTMNRKVLLSMLFAAAAVTLAAQSSQQSPFAGTSNPPPDDQIIDNTPQEPVQAPVAKPPAAQYAAPAPVQPQQTIESAATPAQPIVQP